ncbi:MAG: hypothetical protein AAF629_08100 [Chloroflexota bacterium]
MKQMKYPSKYVNVLFLSVVILLLIACQPLTEFPEANPSLESVSAQEIPPPIRTFYIDSLNGDDQNNGISQSTAWKTLGNVSHTVFQPGDHIYFKRGTSYTGGVTIQGDGTPDHPIVIGAYGDGDAPRFTNPDREVLNGNALQIRGDYQIVENLYFHHTAAARPGASFEQVWVSGALHVSLGHDHAVIRNNEFVHNAKAIHSYSEHSLITHNIIRDPNDQEQNGFLSIPYWGPIGIHLGIGNQEVSYNIIEGMYVEGGEWGGDGGAIEIDDGRNHKDNIYIHHNQTRHNMGFLEISWVHDVDRMPTRNIIIEHNISRDYQDFVFWWAENSQSRINHNTIVRTDALTGMAMDTVFLLDGQDITIRDNIIVVRDMMWSPVFMGEHKNATVHTNNVYWDIDDGVVNLGIEPSEGEFTANPQFVDFDGGDYRLQPGSLAVGLGALNDNPSEQTGDLKDQRSQQQDFEPIVDYDIPQAAQLAAASSTGDWIKLEDSDPRLGVNGGDLWHDPQNSGGTTRTLWQAGDSLTIQFEGRQIRFYGLKSDYMVTADIYIDGVLVADDVPCYGSGHFQALLWESDVLEPGLHTAEIISNGDTVEVDFVEYR